MKALASIETDKSPFDTVLKKGRWTRRAVGSERWVRPSVVVEIAFGEWTPDGHVRHASFRGVRTDKPAKSVRREL